MAGVDELTVVEGRTGHGSAAEFVRRAKARGVWVRPRFATGGSDQVVGYSAALRPADGQAPVWFGGGKLAADLTLPRLRQQWDVVDESQALAEWRRSSEVAGPPGHRRRGPPPAGRHHRGDRPARRDARRARRPGAHRTRPGPAGRPAIYCSKSCRNRAWEVRSAEARLSVTSPPAPRAASRYAR
ncbi:hypothetical protein ACSDR0_42725 [Streptosporangium sp. G11]|uniref:hypothetical protein n=1 Tax=Streptosporangium sp. G11 TaxID=3436926 RepID=UPI003EBAC8E9